MTHKRWLDLRAEAVDSGRINEQRIAQIKAKMRQALEDPQTIAVWGDCDSTPTHATLTVALPSVELDGIARAAQDAGMSMSDWIRRACARELNRD